MSTMTDKILSTDEGYEISYSGGRLADVLVDGKALETVQVRDYDWTTGEFGRMPSDTQIRQRVKQFIDESGGIELYIANS